MDSDVAAHGTLEAQVIHGPGYVPPAGPPGPHQSLGQAIVLASVPAGLGLGGLQLYSQTVAGNYWPDGITGVVLALLWALIHFAPVPKPNPTTTA